MHQHTPRGVRPSVLTLAATGLIASGLAFAYPASAATTTTSASTATASSLASSTTSLASSAVALAQPAAKLVAAKTTSAPGAGVRLDGKIVAPSGLSVAGLRVVLQERRGSTWATVAGKNLSATGAASFTVRPQKTVQHRLRFRGTAQIGAVSSPGVTITIKQGSIEAKLAKVLATAKAQTGDPYRWAAAGPNAFDCSGLTQYAYKSVGITLPHKANSQKGYGRAISGAQARPGDLVIFLSGGYGYHAAIYAGGGYMYDAPHPGATVGKHKIWSSNIIFRRLV